MESERGPKEENREAYNVDIEIRRVLSRLQRKRWIGEVLSMMVTLAVGAAIAVLVVYPLLPDDARSWVHSVQEQVEDLAPWLQRDR